MWYTDPLIGQFNYLHAVNPESKIFKGERLKRKKKEKKKKRWNDDL